MHPLDNITLLVPAGAPAHTLRRPPSSIPTTTLLGPPGFSGPHSPVGPGAGGNGKPGLWPSGASARPRSRPGNGPVWVSPGRAALAPGCRSPASPERTQRSAGAPGGWSVAKPARADPPAPRQKSTPPAQ